MDFSKAKIVEGPKPGDKQKAQIVRIEDTTWRKYLTANGRLNSIGSFENPDATQVLIGIKTVDGREFDELFTAPEDITKISAISNLGKYHELYKKFPAVKDNVEVMADSKGFWKLFVGV